MTLLEWHYPVVTAKLISGSASVQFLLCHWTHPPSEGCSMEKDEEQSNLYAAIWIGSGPWHRMNSWEEATKAPKSISTMFLEVQKVKKISADLQGECKDLFFLFSIQLSWLHPQMRLKNNTIWDWGSINKLTIYL